MINTTPTHWQAVLNRDIQADGIFYYAVHSTKIYCKPSCPSRRPQQKNVTFFETPALAEQAGFRPCKRCHPNEQGVNVIESIKQLLQEEPTPTLAELGEKLELSPFHLQRVFKKATGLSPKTYAKTQKLNRLKQHLQQSSTVTQALYDAGFGSSRELYQTNYLGMTPNTYRKGGMNQTILYTQADTLLGRMLLAATERGVCAIRFGDDETLLAELKTEFPKATLLSDTQISDSQIPDTPMSDIPSLEPYVQAVCKHLEGYKKLELPLDVSGTAFQYKVWQILQKIPYGETWSYSQVANEMGDPKAVRAVASACASNKVALVIPCHRVVRSSGELSGYRWGVERKQKLLEQERKQAGLFE
jgi:AraC family transcriptional regulator, regulatory protein of adaptative response / methylated-DNA-[protein]-cysteine methyltransferase